jgi:hypothetical protein
MVDRTVSPKTAPASSDRVIGVHEGGVAADRIGGDQVHVERGGPGGQIDLKLVEEAVARGEQQLDLVLFGHVGAGVVKLGHGAQGGFLGAARPAQNRDFGVKGACGQCQKGRRPQKCMSSHVRCSLC